ncbi:NUDIX hydrolase [Candidatus Peregrinibacteria bacterium]|nr:NUDIX hydrolase [Candidatus Peregrinibacteria bacterium]
MQSNKKLHFEGDILKLYTWEQTLTNGTKKVFEHVERRPTVSMIAIEGDYVYIIAEHRYEVDEVVDKFPAGFVDDGEEPREAAQRELQEEMGFKAGKLTLLERLTPRSTFDFPEYVFLAENLIESSLPCDDGEDIIEVKKLPMKEVADMILEESLYYSFTSFVFLKYYLQTHKF